MVNPRKVLNARKSKRQPLKDKHKIEKKIREHHRKQRRDAKRNPHKYKKKDPGIPNSWPFKEQLLREQQARREAEREAQATAREARKAERRAEREQAAALQKAAQGGARQRREERRKVAAFAPLHEVLADADVVLLLLDARDPAACRCAALEQALLDVGKLPVLVLNKCDKLPRAALAGWLARLRAELPAVGLSCAGDDAPAAEKPREAAKRKAGAAAAAPAAAAEVAVGDAALKRLLEARLRAARAEDAEAEVRVGILGFDGVGKRSLLRRAASIGGDGIAWLPKAARLQPLSSSMGANDVLLRRCPPERLPQPELLVADILGRAARRPLLRHFGIGDFDDPDGFLEGYGARHLPGGGGARAAAVAALAHLCAEKMPFHTAPPAAADGDGARGPQLCTEMLGEGWAWDDDATVLALAAAKAAAGSVELTAGAPDEIDLMLDDEAWTGGGDESDEESDDGEEGEEGEEESEGEGEEE